MQSYLSPRFAAALSVALTLTGSQSIHAFTQGQGEYCFSCEGNNPNHPVEPDTTPPVVTPDDFDEDTPVLLPEEVSGAFLVGPTPAAIAAATPAELAVTISFTADLAYYSANEFAGAGTTAPLWFSNDGGILTNMGFQPYTPSFAAGVRPVAGYSFQASDDSPNYKSIHIPTVHVIPNGSPEGNPVDMPVGDGIFQIWVEGTAYDFSVNNTFDFTAIKAGGVSSFAITGFDTSESLQTNDPLPFTYGAEFMTEGVVQSIVLPLVAVPEPGSLALLMLACLTCSILLDRNCY